MRCTYCGFVNEDGMKFCANCGTKLNAQQPVDVFGEEHDTYDTRDRGGRGGRGGGAKLAIIIAACVLALALVAGAVFYFVTSAPLNLVGVGAVNTAKAMSGSEATKIMQNVSENGSLSVEVDLNALLEALGNYDSDLRMIGQMIDDASANVTVYTSVKDQRSAVELDVTYDGAQLVDGLVWAGQDSIGASSKAILGKTAYGVNMKDLDENLPDSIFNPDNGSYFALSRNVYNSLLSSANSNEAVELLENSQDVCKDALSAAIKALKDNADIEKESDELDFGDTTKAVTAVTISMDDAAIEGAIADFCQWAADDDGLRDLVEAYDDSIGAASGEYLEDELYDELEYYSDEDNIEGEFEDCELTVVFYITKLSRQLVGFDLDLDEYGYNTKISVTFGPDPASPARISFKYEDKWDSVSATYTVNENSASKYSAKLKIKEDGEEFASGSIKWDKKDGDLKVEYADDWTEIALEGNMLTKGKDTTLEVEYFCYDDGWDYLELEDPGVRLILSESASFPTIPKYEDVASYTDEDEFDYLLDEIESAVEELVYSTLGLY